MASISGRTAVAGVTGLPIRHSLSPTIHNAWLEAVGADGVYVPFTPPAGRFGDFINGLRGGAIRGLNITAPFKEEALRIADERSPRASRAGSANLLVFDSDGLIRADNTDGVGLLYAFRRGVARFDPRKGRVAILGAGGAARGAAAAFIDAGAPAIVFIARNAEKRRALTEVFGPVTGCAGPAQAAAVLRDCSILINATPVGLGGRETPAAPLESLPPDAIVMDMVYRPVETPLLARARELGLGAVDGLDMLIGQAMPSFEAFFGQPPPPIDVRSLALAVMESQSA